MTTTDFKIFRANRLKLSELSEDAFSYLKNVYKTEGQEFTMASPFAQIITVMLNLGKMILFYIENTITELNISTAFHSHSIIGLSTLTGHTPSNGIAARGSVYMTYNNASDYAGETIIIKNYTKLKNTSNGLSYLVILNSNEMRVSVGYSDSKIELPVIQGNIKYQQGTGTGLGLQSFNFANKNKLVDNFFVNIYVNGERWTRVESLLDMTYDQKACIIKPALNGGIDVFFGTGNSGKIPEQGASILCEYLECEGSAGNILENSDMNYWVFEDSGYDIVGDPVNLNEIYVLSSASEVLFGTEAENIEITKQLAPHVSRNFVLANPINYKYFLQKLNMFSVIDAFSGFNTLEDQNIETEYLKAKTNYEILQETYLSTIKIYGEKSSEAIAASTALSVAKTELDNMSRKYEDTQLDDNIIYLYLVPDISKRINDGENYFTCGENRFKLTDDEKNGILNLIESSGQRIITAENKILDPIFVKFAINIFIQMWSNYNFDTVKSSIISSVSDYLISNNRRDRIPVSDLVKIVENVDGVDSVSIFFDADVNNSTYYGEGNYGLDEYGDIILYRNLTDKLGNIIEVNDIYPLFRGGFTSIHDIEYEDDLNAILSPINITLRGKTDPRQIK